MRVSKVNTTSEKQKTPDVRKPSMSSLQKAVKEMMDMKIGKIEKTFVKRVK